MLLKYISTLFWMSVILFATGCFQDAPPGATRSRMVAFASERDGNWEIYRVNLDGSDLTRLTDHPASDRGPWWSEDGLRIRFRSDRSGDFEYFSVDLNGFDIQNYERVGSVSPEGTRRITSEISGGFPQLILHTEYEVDTLTNNMTEPRLSFADWSPDGRTILYLAGMNPGSQQIWSMDIAGRDIQALTAHDGTHNTAEFSPDGGRILFNSNRDGSMSTYIMDTDGRHTSRLLANHISAHASWVTDSLLLLDTESSPGVFDVHVVQDNGIGLVNLSRSGRDGWPSIQPYSPHK
jgi:TolB protein